MNIHQEISLSDILWYKIGGTAKYVLDIENKKDVLEALGFIDTYKPQRILVVGLGANLLVSDDYFDGVVLRFIPTQNPESSISIQSDIVEVFAGERLSDVVEVAFNNNLIGLEWAGGLPGTLGGAVRGNVGAFSGEIKDSVLEVDVIDLNNQEAGIYTIPKDEFEFVYRGSKVKKEKNLLIVSAKLRLHKATEEELVKARHIYQENILYREKNHPLDYPSCGSVFKNIVEKSMVEQVLSVYPDLQESVQAKWHGKVSIAAIINKLGFSGYKIGNAEVSPKHANYILNLGGATFSDVYKIIQAIKEEFYDVFGFDPEVETEIVR